MRQFLLFEFEIRHSGVFLMKAKALRRFDGRACSMSIMVKATGLYKTKTLFFRPA